MPKLAFTDRNPRHGRKDRRCKQEVTKENELIERRAQRELEEAMTQFELIKKEVERARVLARGTSDANGATRADGEEVGRLQEELKSSKKLLARLELEQDALRQQCGILESPEDSKKRCEALEQERSTLEERLGQMYFFETAQMGLQARLEEKEHLETMTELKLSLALQGNRNVLMSTLIKVHGLLDRYEICTSPSKCDLKTVRSIALVLSASDRVLLEPRFFEIALSFREMCDEAIEKRKAALRELALAEDELRKSRSSGDGLEAELGSFDGFKRALPPTSEPVSTTSYASSLVPTLTKRLVSQHLALNITVEELRSENNALLLHLAGLTV